MVLVKKHYILSRDGFIAFDSYQSEKVTNANRELSSSKHLGAFYVTCFACVCTIFTAMIA